MDKNEFIDYITHIDVAEYLIRVEKPLKLATEGNIEDAVTCAIAEGFKMGWDAYKRKQEAQKGE